MSVETPLPVLLAAGRGSRFGGGKLDALCAGKPLGQWALDALSAAGLPPGVIVVGADVPRFALGAVATGWQLVTNPEAASGLGSSIACAARDADGLHVPALMILLADMPLVAPEMLARLCAGDLRIPAATRYPDGRLGVPARFPQAMFGALSGLTGDRGATGLLTQAERIDIETPYADTLLDVDDADSLSRAEALLSARLG